MPEYPGWNLDLRWRHQDKNRHDPDPPPTYPMGIHHNCDAAQSDMLLVREVAMMLIMDRLTDKQNWHVKVFDDDITEKWKTEALAWPEDDLWNRIANLSPYMHEEWQPKRSKTILNRACVDYCILELRHKAKHFERTGVIPTLDAIFSIAKSDTLVPSELHAALREAFARLQTDQASSPDWHPNTNETVQNLVHPSSYPLVYGRSRFIPEEVVGVDDAIDKFAGKGDVIPRKPEWLAEPTQEVAGSFGVGSYGIDWSFWSTTYQWLPANVKFTSDGGVQFSSYINNLHPTKYRDVYSTIEKLIEKALPMWDQCLAQYKDELIGPGRHDTRMHPVNEDDENPDNWDPKSVEEMLAKEAAERGKDAAQVDLENLDDEEIDEIEDRWRDTREAIQPEPPAFDASEVCYDIEPDKTLREQFKDRGLQIIVKMVSIELTPEKPEFPPGGWHVEGQMNEHIVGTALYYLDSENITDSHLNFRTLTSAYQQEEWDVSQNGYHWMESVFGTNLGSGSGSSCLQNYGSVLTPQGRLLAFPNVFQHRVSGFKLADPTKPGHRRFIALWLVDPFTRIISTANVPPQRADWWAERAFGALLSKKNDDPSSLPPDISQLLVDRGHSEDLLAKVLAGAEPAGPKLPPELVDMIRAELGEGLPMGRQEAEAHRLALMQSRTAFQEQARGHWRRYEYNFCEH